MKNINSPYRVVFSELSQIKETINRNIKSADTDLLLEENQSLEKQEELKVFRRDLMAIMTSVIYANEGKNEASEYIQKNLAEGEVDFFIFHESQTFGHKDKISLHLFASNGTELTKSSEGEIEYYYFYDNGACEYKDKNGFHLFVSDGTELTKNAKGVVVNCKLFDDESYYYTDDVGEHFFDSNRTRATTLEHRKT